MDRDGGNKSQRLYRRGSNYAPSKLILDNRFEHLGKRENQDSSEFVHYNRSCGAISRIEMVYTDMKIANNNKINHIMVFFTDYYTAVFLERLPTKTKIGKY